MKRLLIVKLFFSTVTFVQANDAVIEQQNKDYLLHKQKIEQINQNLVPFIQTTQKITGNKKPWLEYEEQCFQIRSVEMLPPSSGTTIDLEKFYPSLALLKYSPDSVIGRCIGQKGLAGVLNYVNEQLIDLGYVSTQVILPEQNLTSGQLRLQLVPGLIGRVKVQNPQNNELFYRLPIFKGEVLNIRDIEKILEQFSRLQGTKATFDIIPSELNSEDVGYSDIIIHWASKKKNFLSLGLNDAGSKSSGQYQTYASYSLENPTGFLDHLLIYYTKSINNWNKEHTDFNNFYISYEVPWRTWIFDINASQYVNLQELEGFDSWIDYKTINRDFNLRAEKEIKRSKLYRLSAYGAIYRKAASSFIDDMEIEVQRKRTAGWETGLTHHFQLGSNSLDTKISFSRGTGMLGASPTAEDVIGVGKSQANIWNVAIQYTNPWQYKDYQFAYQFNTQAQWSPNPLISQDSFSIGGRYNIRGYRSENSLIGNNGYFIQQTLHWLNPLPHISFYMGVDYGGISGEGTQYYSNRQLFSVISGLRTQFKYLNGDFFIGKGINAPQHIKKDMITGFNLSFNF